MIFLEAAYKILKEKKKPLRYSEITEVAIRRGLIETEGQSPELTMHAVLSRDIKVKGKNSLFAKDNKRRGFFYLRKVDNKILHFQLSLWRKQETIEAEEKTKNDNLFIGKAGEYLVAGELLFRKFNATILPVDVGIDIIAERKNKIYSIQVKTSNNRGSRYNFNIRVSSFERSCNDYTFYIFVLRDNKEQKFIILSCKDISKWIKEKLIKKTANGKYYLVPVVERGDQKYFLRNYDISSCINNWKFIQEK